MLASSRRLAILFAFLLSLPLAAQQQTRVQQMKLVGGQSGWLLAANRLFWTNSLGAQWTEITPPAVHAGDGTAGAFFNAQGVGWAVESSAQGEHLSVERTSDSGAHWTASTIDSPFTDGLVFGGSAYLNFSDAQHGSLSLTIASSSNFSRAALYLTDDGGSVWKRLPDPPVGGEFVFTDAQHGTAGSGPDGTDTFSTSDGGLTWQRSARTTTLVRAADGAFVSSALPVTLATFANAKQGWLLNSSGSCTAGVCTQTSTLRGTLDGGKTTFTLGKIPGIPLETTTTSAKPGTPTTGGGLNPKATSSPLVMQMGFDKCEILTTTQMQDWFTNSPYRAVGAYLGGISRACTNVGFTQSWTSTVLSQGWGIIAIWVGPQAPNSTLAHKLSGDPTTDRAAGVSEADAAVVAAAALGMNAGSVLYYDMEAYTRTAASEASTQAFLGGWASELHAKGYLAAVYSSHPELQDWVPGKTGTDSIDDIWFAYFFSTGVACGTKCQNTDSTDIPSTVWNNHNRLRQTSSSFTSTYGSTAASIDEDWTDGPTIITTGPRVSVTIAGPGSGSVTSADTFINCSNVTGAVSSLCSAAYDLNATVTLTATASTLSTFTGFTGCNSTSGNTCTVNVTAAANVTANFNITAPVFTVTSQASSITWNIGSSATSNITLTPNSPYQGVFTMGCTGLPSYLKCAFTPATLTADGSGKALVTVLSLTATSAIGQIHTTHRRDPVYFAIFGLPLLVLYSRKRRSTIARSLSLSLVCAVSFTLCLSGCSDSPAPTPPYFTGTIQVTGSSSGTTQSVPITVTLNH